MENICNFNAGPAAMPKEVLKKAQREFLNFNNTGLSILELSHRSTEYEKMQEKIELTLRELLHIPNNYKILFIQGGASLQFSMIPLNFLHKDQIAYYILTGAWSKKAKKEADKLGNTSVIYDGASTNYRSIPSLNNFNKEDASYIHLTSNNTIYGTQWQSFPDSGSVPLMADMSSDLLSRTVPIERFSLIYAGAQKNIGPAGVTLVIIKNDLLQSIPDIPSMLNYNTYAMNNSRYNTPPVFSIYMISLVLDWLKELGGISEMEKQNEQKAKIIYNTIDNSNQFYKPHADVSCRSKMNITFTLPTGELTALFLNEAKEKGFIGLNGHRSIGGCRVSLYNAVTEESCQKLTDFMVNFQKINTFSF